MSRLSPHLHDISFRLHGLPLLESGDQGFAMSEGAVWCEQAALPGSDMTGPVNAVCLEPSPDAIAPDLNIRWNVEQPVYQIHGVSPSSNVLILFSPTYVQQSAEIGKSAPPRGCGYRDGKHAGIRAQVETFFALDIDLTPVFGGGHA